MKTFYFFVVRFAVVMLLLSVVWLFLTFANLASRLESLAPAEMRLFLELFKNRFFR